MNLPDIFWQLVLVSLIPIVAALWAHVRDDLKTRHRVLHLEKRFDSLEERFGQVEDEVRQHAKDSRDSLIRIEGTVSAQLGRVHQRLDELFKVLLEKGQ